MTEEREERLSDNGSSLESGQEQPLAVIEHRESRISIEDGPFQTVPLIEDLPTEIEYLQCEAFEQNIYLGTTTGDLLHYFEIEPRNYMLVSQTKFNSDVFNPIDKIIILPDIERALVVSDGTLVLFLLPEFAPVPNTPRLSDIADVTLRGYSKSSKCYKLYAAQANSIKLLKVSANNITVFKRYEFKSVNKMVAQGHHLAVAKQNNYELIDLKSSKVIPLFRVSEMNVPLRPVVIEFKNHEFLVATGGGSYDDSSMALVVNYNGDIVNATIVLDKYPSEAIVEYPYLIVKYQLDQISIYKLNDEPKLIQKIKSSSRELQVARTTKEFSGFKRPEIKKKVVEMVRKIPLIKVANQLKVENEQVLVGEIFEEKSSIVLYGTFGIHVLVKPLPILEFNEHNETALKAIRDYLEEIDESCLSKFGQLENNYLLTLMLLLELLHSKNIDQPLINKWCLALGSVDIRLLLYILGFQIYGTLWVFNGLVDMIERLKSLKIYHKCDDLGWLLRTLKGYIEKEKTDEISWDYQNIVKCLDVNIFKIGIEGNPEDIDIETFHDISLEEILRIVEAEQNINLDLRLRIMRKRGLIEQSIELLKKNRDTEKLLGFLEENVEKLPSSYRSKFLEDALFLINNSALVDKSLVSAIMNLLSALNIDARDLLKRIDSNAAVKVLMIQELGSKDANDKQFLVDYYIARMQEFLQDNKMQNILKGFVETYSQDISYSKCSIKDFFLIKLRCNQSLQGLLEIYETLKALCEQEEDTALVKSILEMIESFDINNLLTVMFLPEGTMSRELMPESKLLDIFIAFNDFTTIEKYMGRGNIVRVLEHYTSFKKRQQSLALVAKLLERNTNLIRDEATIISILSHLSSDYALNVLFEFLSSTLKNIGSEQRQLELRKALLKNQISNYHRLIKNSGIDKLEG